jgi:DNA repair photolyase
MKRETLKLIETNKALSKSRIPGIDYTINPYFGCEFGCSYCYADFMSRFSKFRNVFPDDVEWGGFVGVKINIVERLEIELRKIFARGSLIGERELNIWFSIMTDPYQFAEKKFLLTRKCLEVLLKYSGVGIKLNVGVLTRSPLVLRDIDLFKQFVGEKSIEIGISITTDNDNIRKIFEPKAPTIKSRIKTLEKLKENNLKTFAFIGPILPMDARELANQISDFVDYVLIDKMNYVWRTAKIYRDNSIEFAMSDSYFNVVSEALVEEFSSKGIAVEVLFQNKS